MTGSKRARHALLLLVLIVVALSQPSCSSDTRGPDIRPTIVYEVKHDVSPPLFQIPPAPRIQGVHESDDQVPTGIPIPWAAAGPDPVVQRSLNHLLAMPAPSAAFDGVGQGFVGPQGTFTVNSAPPDTNGDVGPNHYIQTTNTDFAIFSKTGTVLYGPVQINTLWSGFGGGCQNNNDGDPMVQYDQLADRWIISQFSVTNGPPYYQCVAVSSTSDPLGTWNRYAFQFNQFNDYPKLSVWPDAYYITFNMFTSGFVGATTCAMDRTSMLAGTAATQQCFSSGSQYGGLLASDLDGPTAPPVGAPNYVINFGANALNLWKFHVDFANAANTTFTGPTSIPVAAFTAECNGGTCVPQKSSTQKLDTLADRLMYRLAYRNFGSYEALVVNHTVDAGGGVAGVRWYEIRSPGTGGTVYQQGTYSPDSTYRWMGSVAMDASGDIAVGYSTSSSSAFPALAYAGRLASDPLGTLAQGETVLVSGLGSQQPTLKRWGDYSAITVDPTDDCTFWYTAEFLKASGRFNWSTRIGSFKFPTCSAGPPPPPPDDFSVTASPASQTLNAGSQTTFTINTAVTSGNAQTVTFSAGALPSGVSASFNPASVTAGQSSVLTLTATAAAPSFSGTITVTGAGPSAQHAITPGLTVVPAAPADDFSLAASPASQTVQAGSQTTFTINTTVTSGNSQTVSFTATNLPSGVTASFNPASVTSGQSSVLTLTAAANAAAFNGTFTVNGNGTAAMHSITPGLTVTPTPDDFSLAVNPASQSVNAGSQTQFTVSTAVTSGNAQTVTFSTSGLPAGVTSSFNPGAVTAGQNSVLTLTAAANASAFNGVFTLTGTAPSGFHSLTPGLTVVGAPPPSNLVLNGDFETGNLNNWSLGGGLLPTVQQAQVHGGAFATLIGSLAPFNGYSNMRQTITIPASGTTTLSFYYFPHCGGSPDQQVAEVRSNANGSTLLTIFNICSNTNVWTQKSSSLTPWKGQSVYLYFWNKDNGVANTATYWYIDDITVTNQ